MAISSLWFSSQTSLPSLTLCFPDLQPLTSAANGPMDLTLQPCCGHTQCQLFLGLLKWTFSLPLLYSFFLSFLLHLLLLSLLLLIYHSPLLPLLQSLTVYLSLSLCPPIFLHSQHSSLKSLNKSDSRHTDSKCSISFRENSEDF